MTQKINAVSIQKQPTNYVEEKLKRELCREIGICCYGSTYKSAETQQCTELLKYKLAHHKGLWKPKGRMECGEEELAK